MISNQQVMAPDLVPFLTSNIADAIDLLNACKTPRAAAVVSQLPLARCIDMFDRPELLRAGQLISQLSAARATELLEGMADDRAADVLLELDESERARLSGRLRRGTLEALRRLMAGEPNELALTQAQRTEPVWVAASTAQEEVARLIRRHDLLAIPVLDEARHVLGIVTVDDILDALIAEGTEDAHKFGGLQAFDRPYIRTGFWSMIKKRAGWLCALFLAKCLPPARCSTLTMISPRR